MVRPVVPTLAGGLLVCLLLAGCGGPEAVTATEPPAVELLAAYTSCPDCIEPMPAPATRLPATARCLSHDDWWGVRLTLWWDPVEDGVYAQVRSAQPRDLAVVLRFASGASYAWALPMGEDRVHRLGGTGLATYSGTIDLAIHGIGRWSSDPAWLVAPLEVAWRTGDGRTEPTLSPVFHIVADGTAYWLPGTPHFHLVASDLILLLDAYPLVNGNTMAKLHDPCPATVQTGGVL
jgi:hypothetical protein